jgi:hypothetical protein
MTTAIRSFERYVALALALSLQTFGQVKIARDGDRITVDVQGKPFTALYVTGAETTKPYFHPVRAASGTIVTRRYPMEALEGELHNEKHQRGLWFSHGDVNGLDFWDNEASYTTPNRGFIVLDRVIGLASGDKTGSIEASFKWVDPKQKALIEDTRKMVFYSDPELRTIDFHITLRAIEKVTFNDSKEGVFGMRLAAGLEAPTPKAPPLPKRTGMMVNSNGEEGENQCWGKRANWVDTFGEVEGEKLGVAIFDNPGNPGHPTYWHVRSYGLFAANIFGRSAFEHNTAVNGSRTLEPGETLTFRYHVVVHPGDYKTVNIAALYDKYATMK